MVGDLADYPLHWQIEGLAATAKVRLQARPRSGGTCNLALTPTFSFKSVKQMARAGL
jgi:hypothetical protein